MKKDKLSIESILGYILGLSPLPLVIIVGLALFKIIGALG